MGFLTTRATVVSVYVAERVRYGLREQLGPLDHEVLCILDGVGRFQFAPLLIRKVLREQQINIGSTYYDWQFGLVGEIWTDLMWLRRNRVMAARLARKLLAFRRNHPKTTIHLVAFSGGAAIATFALESLRGRRLVETLLLACPSLSPGYNMSRALSCVTRAYALVSRKDLGVLGVGTTIFGTSDRRFVSAAGRVGFCIPASSTDSERKSYARLREIRWSPALKRLGHNGGHTGWVQPKFLREHLLAMLKGEPKLPTYPVDTE